MSKVRLYGDTSGFVDLKAPDVASNVTITLPNTAGPFATETYVDAAVAAIPEIAGIGTNVVQTVKTDAFTTASSTFTDLTGLSVTITPTSNTSKVLVLATIAAATATNNSMLVQLVRDSTNIAVSTAGSIDNLTTTAGDLGSSQIAQLVVMHLDNPAKNTATTYKVEVRVAGGGSVNVNRRQVNAERGFVSSITAIEVAA